MDPSALLCLARHMDDGPGLFTGRVAAHSKRGKCADATLALFSTSVASACCEAEPCRVASTLLLVGMKHGELPPGEAAPTARQSRRGPGLDGSPCLVGLC